MAFEGAEMDESGGWPARVARRFGAMLSSDGKQAERRGISAHAAPLVEQEASSAGEVPSHQGVHLNVSGRLCQTKTTGCSEEPSRVGQGRGIPCPRKPASPFRYFNSSPEVIRLVVLMYVRFPLSLRNVEDLLFKRGIDICHETVWL